MFNISVNQQYYKSALISDISYQRLSAHMRQKIIKAGNSLAVVIPHKFVKSLGLKKGDWVKSQITITRGKITYSFSGAQQLSLDEELNT